VVSNAQSTNRLIRHRLANRRPTNWRSHDTPSKHRPTNPESMAKLMSDKILYWDYQTQVYLAYMSGVSISWLRKECRQLAESQGKVAVFEHKPRSK